MDTISWNIEAERDLWRAICAPNHWHARDGVSPSTHPESLRYFIYYCWGIQSYFEKHPEQPVWFHEPIHGPYLQWLQKHLLKWKALARRGSAERYYIGVVLPRGYGKTVTATKSAMLWCHLDEPDMSTLFCSATSDLATDVLKAIQAVCGGEDEDSWFSWLYGNWRQGAKQWTREYAVHGYRSAGNISEPSFDTAAVDSGMTGYHHRIHVWDDPLIRNKMREGGVYLTAVHDAVNASYNALQMNGLLMFVLTRYEDDDVAGRHFKEEGIASLAGMDYPSTSPFEKIPLGEGAWHVFFYQTENPLTGEPTQPRMWTREKIAEAKRRDAEDFASQQQNDPGSSARIAITDTEFPPMYMDYNEFFFQIQGMSFIEYASIHIDTAFKRKENIGKGDDNAIVVWLHDSRRNGMVYLDTENLFASNEWTENDFTTQLIRVFLNLKKRGIRVQYLTDEVEPGGKAGSYKNRLMGILKAGGIRLKEENLIQFNRTIDKKARIRTGIGNYREGYVKILLKKDRAGNWIVPPVVKKLIGQLVRIDVIKHEDIADAATDGFAKGIWRGPSFIYASNDEGSTPRQPGDENLRALSRPLTNEEIFEMIDTQKEFNDAFGPGHGPDDGYDIDDLMKEYR